MNRAALLAFGLILAALVALLCVSVALAQPRTAIIQVIAHTTTATTYAVRGATADGCEPAAQAATLALFRPDPVTHSDCQADGEGWLMVVEIGGPRCAEWGGATTLGRRVCVRLPGVIGNQGGNQ